MEKIIPCFKLSINPDDETGVQAIALVDDPAIQSNWIAFNKQNKHVKVNLASQNFQAVEGERRVLRGAVMIPNLKIFRLDKSGNEFYVEFDKETIYQMVKKYFKMKNTDKVNMMHNSNAIADSVYLIESFIIDSENNIHTPNGFEKQPDGTWFITMAVDNENIWNDFVKTGQFKGFSLEGDFIETPSTELTESEIQTIVKSIQ